MILKLHVLSATHLFNIYYAAGAVRIRAPIRPGIYRTEEQGNFGKSQLSD
jgi:hypothetical protein